MSANVRFEKSFQKNVTTFVSHDVKRICSHSSRKCEHIRNVNVKRIRQSHLRFDILLLGRNPV